MAGGAIATTRGNGNFEHLLDPNRKWYNNRRLIFLHLWILLFLITSSTNGFDNSLMNSFQSLSQWEDYFGTPQGGKLGLLNAIQNIGSLAGYPFAPYLSDGIGRRPTIWFGATIMLVGVAVQSASHNLGMFIGARFCIGFGLTFAANSAPMLVTEISYPTYRAPLTSLYNALWYTGNIIASWTTFGTSNIHNTWSWRIPSLLQGLPSAFQFCLVLLAPESPRWLISKGKEQQALKTLAYYHADGNEHDPLVLYEFEEIKAAISLDRETSKNAGWLSLFATPGNRKRLIIIIAIAWFSQWSGNGLVSFYLNKVFDTIGITDSTIQLLITGILAIWNLFWAVLASLLVDRAGRRTLFLTSAGGMVVFFSMQTVCSAQFALHGNPAAAHAVIAFIFLFYAAYDLAFTPLIVSYTVEILPYSLRAKGFNVFNFVISLALIFNQYVNPIALDKLAWKYYIVYCCWLAFEFVFLYFMIVETKGLTLEETAALFDGEDISQRVLEEVAPRTNEVRLDDRDVDSTLKRSDGASADQEHSADEKA
ncbi:hexose transporter [Laetiporus sulphureus 93-53]|uniref:Hexose transporter n=1 Tax=Laetiporus sulphureus 93-53 TaxID=1314785 RepID=A0A165EIH0_9APHY|nr:hexose transporter [Laetiporus sulphureus 93-53]KZT07121.1 hexose transporter [Laetiporus sulphureus 93-53]